MNIDTIFHRFIGAPAVWLNSDDGRRLVARSIRLVRSRYGRETGREFRDKLTASGAWPGCNWLNKDGEG